VGNEFHPLGRIAAAGSICVTLLLAGCGSGGGGDLSGIGGGSESCNNGSDSYTPINAPVTAIAAAERLSFAINDDGATGSLWAWGYSDKGQLGDGTVTNSVTPVKIGDGYTAVSAGVGHSLGLKSDGTLWAWGDNTYGQLGDGTTTSSNVPEQIDIANSYSAISAGYKFSLGLRTNGDLYTWGNNKYGQLGDGTVSDSYIPKYIGTGFSAISAGDNHVLALKSDGSLWAWGADDYGQLGDGCYKNFTTESPVCALRSTTNSSVPEQIDVGKTYTAIAAGYQYSLAIRSDGTLWAWGNNTWGDLGSTSDSTKDCYSGSKHRCFPSQIDDATYTAISASKYNILGDFFYYSSLGLKSDGSVWSWGDNLFGQLGNGTLSTGYSPNQIVKGFTAIAMGEGDHALAIKDDGSLWAWGSNLCGELGDGKNNSSKVPIKVSK
jgi:alpha-tubulin suppressor-like RCC1 family protein